MGNRANVRVTELKSEVFLYTHWAGNELPKVIQRDHVIHVDVDNQMIRYKEHEFTFQEFAALKTVPGWCSLK